MKKKKVCTEEEEEEYNGGYYLPIEVTHEILTWLPGSALLRFKCVCKSWYRLISDPNFINLHLAESLKTIANSNSNTNTSSCSVMLVSYAERLYKQLPTHQIYHFSFSFHPNNLVFTPLSYPNNDAITIFVKAANEPISSLVVGSCHGLVCIQYAGVYRPCLIYNPTTRASKVLPLLEFSGRLFDQILGFGYDCVSDDYKVLSTWYRGDSIWKSMYYSLKTDAWETVDNPPWYGTVVDFANPFYFNNSFHWLHCQGIAIKCFSLSTRSYYEIPIPQKIHYRSEKLHTWIPSTNRLTQVKGHLCVVTSFFDIWMLKEYGNNKSWTQVFHNTESLLMVTYYKGFLYQKPRVACFQDDHSNFILLLASLCWQSPMWLYCDVVSGTAKEIEMPSFPAKVGLCLAFMGRTWRLVHSLETLILNDELGRVCLYAVLFLPLKSMVYRDNKKKKVLDYPPIERSSGIPRKAVHLKDCLVN